MLHSTYIYIAVNYWPNKYEEVKFSTERIIIGIYLWARDRLVGMKMGTSNLSSLWK